MLGHDLIKAGSASVVVAGGMESMTNAPHMVNARTGIRYGDGQLVDHMAWDGLTNPYDGKSMGVFGEDVRRQVPLHPRGAGRVRDRVGQPRQGGAGQRRLRRRDRAGHGQRPQG